MKWTLLCGLSNGRESSSNLFGLVLRLRVDSWLKYNPPKKERSGKIWSINSYANLMLPVFLDVHFFQSRIDPMSFTAVQRAFKNKIYSHFPLRS